MSKDLQQLSHNISLKLRVALDSLSDKHQDIVCCSLITSERNSRSWWGEGGKGGRGGREGEEEGRRGGEGGEEKKDQNKKA